MILTVLAFAGTAVVRGLAGGPGPLPSVVVPTTAFPTPGPILSRPTGRSGALTRYPRVQIAAAEQQICPGCDVGTSARLTRVASHALGPTRDLVVRRIGNNRGLVIGALYRDGAELLAVVTQRGHPVMSTRLGIAPPIGVQTQRNDHDLLVVVVSGSEDAVALLGRPSVQRWLATLHP